MNETIEIAKDIFRLLAWTARRLSDDGAGSVTLRGAFRCAGGVIWLLYLTLKMRMRPH